MQRWKSTNLWMLVLPPVSGPTKWNRNATPASVDAWFGGSALRDHYEAKLLRSVVNKAISKLLLHGGATNNTSRKDRDWSGCGICNPSDSLLV